MLRRLYVSNPSTYDYEIDKYLENYTYVERFIDDSAITYDKIVDTPDTLSINSISKKSNKMDYDMFHTLLLVAIFLLIITTSCCKCIKHRLKQRYNLPYW